MSEYGPDTYGERIADRYDDWYAPPPGAVFDRLTELAGGGPALELGIGTGRVALPLVERGIEVHGVDASPAMVERLRTKAGGEDVHVAIGDFADVPVDGSYALVFVVFNTFFGILDQESQVRCFENVSARLAPGGAFLIEAFVPDVTRFERGQRVSASHVDAHRIQLEVSQHDAAAQRTRTQHVVITDRGVELLPVQIRYAWPSELDLMARLAGLTLESRWDGWEKADFTADSPGHVSVWRKPG
ncbi:MAG: class I SAM-dependent methyltransferase [Gemmatimonadota bacterium]|nr:class I SAM-dependent methyltransferase [Gemmatimonadota bacterium]